MRKISFIFIFFFLLSGLFSQQNDLRYFVGHWAFEGWLAANKTQAPDFTADWFVENGLDSVFCLRGYVLLNEKIFTREQVSYNTAEKKYTRTISANDGSYYEFKSIGWEGTRLVWLGKQFTKSGTTLIKEEITFVSISECKVIYFTRTKNKWEPMLTEVLKRIS